MPDTAEHEEQARHNADLYRLLRRTQPPFSDWATTALFYSGVHVAEAFLYPAHSENHNERFRALRRRKRHEAASLLLILSVQSRAARYACPPPLPAWRLDLLEHQALVELPRALRTAAIQGD
ncbi:MAG: hypothetical protein WCP98_19250 [Actinomycetes bacterium]